MKDQRLNRLVKIALLSAIAFILMFLESIIPGFPPFLKLDISDIPALLGTFALGPSAGVAIEFIKNLIHGIIPGTNSAWSGELANFLVGSALVYTAGVFYRLKRTRKNAIVGLIAGTVVMTIVAALFNYYFLIPFYAKIMGQSVSAIVAWSASANHSITSLKSLIMLGIVPFNILKGIIIAIITLLIYKRISPLLNKEAESMNSAVKNIS